MGLLIIRDANKNYNEVPPHKRAIIKKSTNNRASLVQRLRLCAPNAGGSDSIPVQGTRSHMLQLKICMPQLRPHAAKLKKKFVSLQITNDGEAAEKREQFCTVGGIVSWCIHYGKQ